MRCSGGWLADACRSWLAEGAPSTWPLPSRYRRYERLAGSSGSANGSVPSTRSVGDPCICERAGGTARRGPRGRRGADALDTRKVREWAKTAGIDIKERGRVPAQVIEKYKAAGA
jgi:hypothetical protein